MPTSGTFQGVRVFGPVISAGNQSMCDRAIPRRRCCARPRVAPDSPAEPSRIAWLVRGIGRLILLGAASLPWLGIASTAPASSPTRDAVAPSWWGGPSDTLDEAVQAAAEWAKSTAVSPSIQGRAWITVDGRWGVGAALVQAAPRDSSELAEEARQTEQDAVELAARDRALRAAAVQLAPDRDPVALEGRAGKLWRERGSFEIKARLDPAPRTRLYEAPGRLYAIALIDVSSVRTLSLGDEEIVIGEGLADFRRWGLIEIAASAADAAVVEAALREAAASPAEAPLLIAAAATAIDRGRRDLAAPWIAGSLASPIDLGELLQLQHAITRQIGVSAPLLDRLASASDLGVRLGIVGDAWIDSSGGEPSGSAFVLVDGRPLEISIRKVPDGDDGELREAAAFSASQVLGEASAATRTVFGTIAADGTVLAKERSSTAPSPVRGEGVAVALGARAVVAHRGGVTAQGASEARLVPIVVPAIERRGDWASRRQALVRAAIAQWCLDTCRIEALSSGQVAAACEAGDVTALARWVVPEQDAAAADARHRVLLDSLEVDSLIETSLPDAAISIVGVHSSDRGSTDRAESDRRKALRVELARSLAASGWRIGSNRSDAIEVALDIKVDLEPGEEPGSFGKPKPFVEPVVSARLFARGEPIPGAAVREVGRRVFGTHSPAQASIEAEGAAVAALSKVASVALREHLLFSPHAIGPEGAEHAARFDRRWWADLASRCETESPLGGENARWAGGAAGLARFCEAVSAVAPSPSGVDSKASTPRGRP